MIVRNFYSVPEGTTSPKGIVRGRARRLCLSGKYIDHRLAPQPEPHDTFRTTTDYLVRTTLDC